MIVSSAVMTKSGKIYAGKRHNNCFEAIRADGNREIASGMTQGFLTENGVFLTRTQAEKYARNSGQLTKPLIGSVLTSEDLW